MPFNPNGDLASILIHRAKDNEWRIAQDSTVSRLEQEAGELREKIQEARSSGYMSTVRRLEANVLALDQEIEDAKKGAKTAAQDAQYNDGDTKTKFKLTCHVDDRQFEFEVEAASSIEATNKASAHYKDMGYAQVYISDIKKIS